SHIGDRAGTPYPPADYGASLAHYSIAPFSIAKQIPQFVFSVAFERNVTFTFEEDYLGAKLLAYDWAYIKDSAIWGADYPHEQGVWPDPSAALDRMFEGLTPEYRRE